MHSSWKVAHCFGAALAVTEMQPCPPCAISASAVPSSPESWMKSSPHASRCCVTRSSFAVASFTPTTFGSAASFAIVSTDMSITLRGGML